MSVRFPHHGSRHEAPEATGPGAGHEFPGTSLPRVALHDAPDRACCCLAKPVVKVVMPAGGGRPDPVDLWLCGHHWRASRARLAQLGAAVYEVAPPSVPAGGAREGAAV